MDTDNFIVHVKAEGIYIDIETRFDTSNYALGRPLPRGKKLFDSWKMN